MKVFRASLMAFCAFFWVPPLLAADKSGSWTLHDVNAAADAYVKAASGLNKNTQATMLAENLADALIKAGDIPKAKEILLYASKLDKQDNTVNGEIIEKLAGLGDGKDAEKLAKASPDDAAKTIRLGKLGVGLAHAGDIAGALKAAAAIPLPAKEDEPSALTSKDLVASGIPEIVYELNSVGAIDEGVKLANELPDRFPKLVLIGQAAQLLCSKKPADSGNLAKGQGLAQQATAIAKRKLETAIYLEKISFLAQAGNAIIECKGVDAVKSFFAEEKVEPKVAEIALYKLASRLIERKEYDLARAIAPAADQASSNSLVAEAQLLMAQKDVGAAKEVVIKASQLAIQKANDKSSPPPDKYGFQAHLGDIFEKLIQLGDYDNALATVQPIEIQNRQPYYIRVIEAEVQKHDDAAIARTLPQAIEAFKTPTPVGSQATRFLFELINVLAAGGYKEQTLQAYRDLQNVLKDKSLKARPLDARQKAELQVDIGDLDGALQIADRAGPLTVKQTPYSTTLMATLLLENNRRTEADDDAMVERVQAMGPELAAGPKAKVLSDIAVMLAGRGDIKGALRAESGLGSEKSGALFVVDDQALRSIAEAQTKSGDLKGAFSTIQRIMQPKVRRQMLLELCLMPHDPDTHA